MPTYISQKIGAGKNGHTRTGTEIALVMVAVIVTAISMLLFYLLIIRRKFAVEES